MDINKTRSGHLMDIETIGRIAFYRVLKGQCRSIDLTGIEYAYMKAYMALHDIEWDKITNLKEIKEQKDYD